MGFLFGVVNLDGQLIEEGQLQRLAEKVKWPGFLSYEEYYGSFGMGYCHRPDRPSRVATFRKEEFTLICDARIYNLEELKQSFSFNNLAELFFLAYQKWGEGFPNYINGDFAGVIIDEQNQHVLLVRDHIGVRPLCYTLLEDTLVFASHEFGIAASGCTEIKLCEKAFLAEYLTLNVNTPYEQTSFERIKKCVPGFTTIVEKNSIRKEQYWFPEKIQTNKSLSIEESISNLRELLKDVTLVRTENAKIGTHVSGGLDSCGVAAVLACNVPNPENLQGYSWSPDQLAHDPGIKHEKFLIDEFVKETGISLKYIPTAAENLLSRLETPEFERVEVEEATMRLAEKDDIEYMFSGWGGDEFLSISGQGAMNHIVFNGHFLDFARYVKRYGIRTTLATLRLEVLPVFKNSDLTGKKERNKYLSIFKSGVYGSESELLRNNGLGFIYAQRHLRKVLDWKIYHYHLPQRMDSWAYYGEKYGIEYKFPLLDKALLEYYLTVPVEYSYRMMQPRYIFKEIMKGILPDVIRTRNDKQDYLFHKYIMDKKERLFDFLNSHLQYFRDFEGNELMDIPKVQALANSRPTDLYDVVNRILLLEIFIRYREMHRKYINPVPVELEPQISGELG